MPWSSSANRSFRPAIRSTRLDAANRAIAVSSLREDAHRLVMRVLAAGGRRADALKHYEEFAALLKRELAVEPDPTHERSPHSFATISQAARPRIRSPRPVRHRRRINSPGAARSALDRGAAVRQHERRSRAGVFRRRHGRGHSHGPVARALAVRDRPPVELHLQGRAADVQQIGRELGVRYVLEGSVRKSGNRVRIVAQLIETETGAHIWADRFDGDLRDIFALQDEITERIVSAVELNVQAAEIKRARAKPTDNLTAYDLYLRALPAYFGQTEADYKDPTWCWATPSSRPRVFRGTRYTDRQRRRTYIAGLARELDRRRGRACRLAERAVAGAPGQQHLPCECGVYLRRLVAAF